MQYTSLMKGMVLKGMFRTFIYRCVYNQYQSDEFKCGDLIYQQFLSDFAFSYFWPAATDKKFVERSNSKEITARCKVLYQT